MSSWSVLISGAGIAGNALAFWLGRYGFRPTVVEIAPDLRAGGFPVDFRGRAHLAVLARMGVLEEVRAHQTPAVSHVIVDEAGRPVAEIPSELTAGGLEILRGDLVQILYQRAKDAAEYRFADSISSLTPVAGGVRAQFERSAPRTFDLVVAADGLHSRVRGLVFGPERRYLRYLGYYAASFTIPDDQSHADVRLNYNVPGRLVAVNAGPGWASASFIFASEQLEIDHRDIDRQRQVVARAYDGVGWQAPRLISAMWQASDFSFEPIGRVEVDRYIQDRVVLLGDAGYGGYGAMGTGLALVGAYILAGELAASRQDHRAALERYQEQLRGYATRCQAVGGNTGRFFVPDTWEQIHRRNRAFRLMRDSPRMRELFVDRTQQAASSIDIVDYPTVPV